MCGWKLFNTNNIQYTDWQLMKLKVSSTKLYQLLRWRFKVGINVLSSSTINVPAKIGPERDPIATPSTCLYIKLLYVK